MSEVNKDQLNKRELRKKAKSDRSGKKSVSKNKTIKLEVIQETLEKVEEWTGAKPRVRSDCEFCHVCQMWREGSIEDQETLPCGHSNEEAIMHTRPCVYVSCRHNLYLDVKNSGNYKLTRENTKPEDMKESCVLDVVEEEGPLDDVKIGEILNIHRVRVEQIEHKSLKKLRESKNEDIKKLRDLKHYNTTTINESGT